MHKSVRLPIAYHVIGRPGLTISSCSATGSAWSLTERYMIQSSANSLGLELMLSGRSLMNRRNGSGPSTEP